MRIADARGSCEGLFPRRHRPYEQYGFRPLSHPERMMEIIDADVYAEEPER